VALKRLLRPFEYLQDLPEIGPDLRHIGSDFQRGCKQAVRLADAAKPPLDGAEQVQRIEMIGCGFEHASINLLRVAQAALPVQSDRFVESLAEIEGCGVHR